MPNDAQTFVKKLRSNAVKELDQVQPFANTAFAQQGALMSSLHTVSSMSAGVSILHNLPCKLNKIQL